MKPNVPPIRGCGQNFGFDVSTAPHEAVANGLTRRNFLRYTTIATLGFLGSRVIAAETDWAKIQLQYFRGQDVLSRIAQKATAEKWKKLLIGEVVGKVAMELAGTRWAPYSLEASADEEFCVVNLKGMDCFTFIENSLCLARIIKRSKTSAEDLIREVEFTLYRGGKMGDFSTRLHYTSDWMYDNEKKGVLEALTPKLPGVQPLARTINYMSSYPATYKQLQAHPELIAKIKATEDQINARSLMYLPMSKLKEAEHLLKTGDIIGCTEERPAIDIGHCGLCLKDEKGRAHFVDASSIRKKMRVTYEPDIANSLRGLSRVTGVMIARPLELKKA